MRVWNSEKRYLNRVFHKTRVTRAPAVGKVSETDST
jgi:hypothetical protein